MILQQWCACGAGVVGDAGEEIAVAQWIELHPQQCEAGLVDEKPVTVSYGCATCMYRAYGRSTEEAVEVLDLHECRTAAT